VVGAINQVLRADKANDAIDDDDLAVVAQVDLDARAQRGEIDADDVVFEAPGGLAVFRLSAWPLAPPAARINTSHRIPEAYTRSP
jgi:hypothetical protein